MKKAKNRIILLLILIIMTYFFSSDFTLIDIQKTALIVAIGIDKKEDKYEVTAQIAVPQATDQTAKNNDSVVSAEGSTIVQAIDNIGIQTGWRPKMSFCDLILFGNEVASENISYIIENLLSSRYIQTTALLAVCDTPAKDVLTATTPLDAISSFAIQKIILKNPLKVNTISSIDIKTFAMQLYSNSKTAYMPLLKMKESEDDNGEGGSSSQMASTSSDEQGSGGGGGSGGSSGGGGKKKNVIFDLTSTVVYSKGNPVVTFDKEETLIFNLLLREVEESFISIKQDENNVLLAIHKNKKKIYLDFGEKPQLHVNLQLTVGIADSTTTLDVKRVAEREIVDERTLQDCKNYVTELLNSMTEKLANTDADLFHARNILYRFYHNQFEDLKDLPLSNYEFIPEITIKSLG